jgi:hypothetical protein
MTIEDTGGVSCVSGICAIAHQNHTRAPAMITNEHT